MIDDAGEKPQRPLHSAVRGEAGRIRDIIVVKALGLERQARQYWGLCSDGSHSNQDDRGAGCQCLCIKIRIVNFLR